VLTWIQARRELMLSQGALVTAITGVTVFSAVWREATRQERDQHERGSVVMFLFLSSSFARISETFLLRRAASSSIRQSESPIYDCIIRRTEFPSRPPPDGSFSAHQMYGPLAAKVTNWKFFGCDTSQ